jgi:antitoxin (DNA-binding transcriptional repressor) of toxin-antitoxin stability system
MSPARPHDARKSECAQLRRAYPEAMSELPLDDGGPDISAAAHDAAQGHVVYLTEHGERLAAIVPAEFAAALEGMTPDQARELLEDMADVAAARQALDEPGEDIPAEQVWTELGLT